MKNIRVSLLITGQVQGVGYRAWAKRTANEFCLTGWVRNLPDDSVEALVEGADEDVLEFVEECRTGPSMAKVESVDVTYQVYTGEYRDFRIAQ